MYEIKVQKKVLPLNWVKKTKTDFFFGNQSRLLGKDAKKETESLQRD